jgi:hypothetical protein
MSVDAAGKSACATKQPSRNQTVSSQLVKKLKSTSNTGISFDHYTRNSHNMVNMPSVWGSHSWLQPTSVGNSAPRNE